MNYKRQIIYTVLFVTGFFVTSSVKAQVGEIPREARVYVENWLFLNCGTPKGKVLDDSLTIWGEILVPHLVEAYKSGPGQSLLDTAKKAAEQRYAERQRMLGSGESPGLSKEDLEAARKVSRETYLKRQEENFMQRYKSQALSGLSVIGGEKAKQALQGAANDADSPLRGVAQEALKKLK